MKVQKSALSILAVALAVVMVLGMLPVSAATPLGSSDQGDGTYTNPAIWADVPDMSIIRVGDAYYMSSTVMHLTPGVPIMKSYDLVNWKIISYCYLVMGDSDNMKLQTGKNMYTNGTWASAPPTRTAFSTAQFLLPRRTRPTSSRRRTPRRSPGADMSSVPDTMTAVFCWTTTEETGSFTAQMPSNSIPP